MPSAIPVRSMVGTFPRLSVALTIASACAVPFFLGDYRVFQLTLVIVHAIALIGLNLLTGYAGQISLGHGAFYAIGAYTTAILMEHFGVPYWLTIPVAGAVCLVTGGRFRMRPARRSAFRAALPTARRFASIRARHSD